MTGGDGSGKPRATRHRHAGKKKKSRPLLKYCIWTKKEAEEKGQKRVHMDCPGTSSSGTVRLNGQDNEGHIPLF